MNKSVLRASSGHVEVVEQRAVRESAIYCNLKIDGIEKRRLPLKDIIVIVSHYFGNLNAKKQYLFLRGGRGRRQFSIYVRGLLVLKLGLFPIQFVLIPFKYLQRTKLQING